MENNKGVKNIVDDPKQHPIEAPPPQGYPHEDSLLPADNPLQPPKLQQLPAGGSVDGGGEEERKASTEMDQASGWKFEECCCAHGCLRGLQCPRMDPCGTWSWALVGLCIAAIMVVTCCWCGKACR